MADLRHITQFLPSLWHMDLEEWKRSNNLLPFREYLKKRRSPDALKRYQGALGEMQVASWVHSITGDSNVLFNGVLVPNEDSITSDTEIDLIWVNQNGVLVVEVKTYRGDITVYGNEEWHRTSGIHAKKVNTIENPFGQVFTQTKVLKQYLKAQKVHLPVYAVLVLPAANKVQIVDRTRIPILRSREDLLQYQRDYSAKEVPQKRLSSLLLILSRLERL